MIALPSYLPPSTVFTLFTSFCVSTQSDTVSVKHREQEENTVASSLFMFRADNEANHVTVDIFYYFQTPIMTLEFLVPHLPCSPEEEIGTYCVNTIVSEEAGGFEGCLYGSQLPSFSTVTFTSPVVVHIQYTCVYSDTTEPNSGELSILRSMSGSVI